MTELVQKPFFFINFLTGIIFIVAALIQIKFPPKKINSLYGYRTRNSMKSQEAWDFAQSYSSKLMLIFGAGLCSIAIISNMIFPLKIEYQIVLSILIINITVVVMIVIVEKKLKKRF